MVREKKALLTLASFTFSLSLLLLVCNLYVGGDWFIVAFVSVILGLSLVFLPFVLSSIPLPDILADKKALLYFSTESLLLLLLLWVCAVYTGGGWFFNRALPIAGFSLLLPWGFLLFIRYCPVNSFLKTSGCFALSAAFDYSIQGFLHFILQDGSSEIGFQFDFFNWSQDYLNGNINMIVFLVLLLLAILFLIAGIARFGSTLNAHKKSE